MTAPQSRTRFAPRGRPRAALPLSVSSEAVLAAGQVSASPGEPRGARAVGATPQALVGSYQPRLDGVAKVSGQAVYTHDVALPDLCHAVVLRCPFPSALVVSVDDSVARSMPGVRAVISYPEKRIRFAGDDVAGVAADTLAQARDALQALVVTYEVYPAVVTIEDALAPDAPKVFDGRANAAVPRVSEVGDVEAGFAQSAAVIEGDYRTQVQTHSCMETHCAVVRWDDARHVTAWVSTQGINLTRQDLAGQVGLKPQDVRVICEHMGGGFGSKISAGPWGLMAAELARQAGRPVKLLLDRYGEQVCTGNRPDSIQHLKVGASAEGKLTALELSGYGTAGVGSGAGFGTPARVLYPIPSYRVSETPVYTNCGPAAAMRAPGYPQGVFALESALDDLADALGMDPVTFRELNNDSPNRAEAFRIGAERFGWGARMTAGSTPGYLKRGVGVASCVWSSGASGTYEVEVQVTPQGQVTVLSGVQDIGTGTRTWMAMLVADALGLPLEQVQIRIGDSDFPTACFSGGSTTSPSMAAPTRQVGENTRSALASLVAESLGCDPSELVFADGRITAPSGASLAFAEACAFLSETLVLRASKLEAETLNNGDTYGVHFVEVEVDTRTGCVRVVRVTAVHESGCILNRLTAESQIIGGVIQGINYALFEERIMDRASGQMLNANLEHYKIGGARDIPQIDPYMMEVDITGQYVGALGMAEQTNIPTAAAIRNAIKNATGCHLYELPMTPARVLAALQAQAGAPSQKKIRRLGGVALRAFEPCKPGEVITGRVTLRGGVPVSEDDSTQAGGKSAAAALRDFLRTLTEARP